jgi:hypothetical protein
MQQPRSRARLRRQLLQRHIGRRQPSARPTPLSRQRPTLCPPPLAPSALAPHRCLERSVELESGVAGTALAASGAFATLGILFIPSKGPEGKWVHVGGPGDISYYRNPDEPGTRVRYTTADGKQHTIGLMPDHNGDYRDPEGNILARTLKAIAKTGIVVSTAELVGNDHDEPRLCPAPAPDRYLGERGKLYEDYMKAWFNPGHPTPSGMAYYFINPKTGDSYAIDDCQQKTGILAEYKGPNFEEHMIEGGPVWKGMVSKMLKQSLDQEQAAGQRPLIWFFAEKSVADEVRKIFGTAKEGRERIKVESKPLPGDAQ